MCRALPLVALLVMTAIGVTWAPAAYAHTAATRTATGTNRPAIPMNLPDLSDVACPSARVCYAVGYSGVHDHGAILATTDGGHTWHAQTPGTSWGLRGVSCPLAATCYAVGYAETTVRTANAGRTWRPTRPLGYQDLGHVACPTTHACLAVGISGAYGTLYHRIVRIADDGRTWSYPPTPIDATRYPLLEIACPAALVCYAVGAGATILVTRDGGRSWRLQHNPAMDNSGLTPPLSGVACASERACMVVGGFPAGGIVMTTGDGGRTWTNQAGPARSTPNAVACPTAQVCDIVGYDGLIARTGDGGRTWASMDSGTSTSLNGIACHGPSFCVVVGNAGFIAVVSGRPHAAPTAPSQPTAPASSQPTAPASSQPTARPTASSGGSQPTTQPTASTQSCSTWNVSGSWTFTAASTSMIGSGSGQATFTQSGSTLSGTLALAGATYTMKGTITGNAVTLTLSAPGLIDTALSGTISSDGSSIDVGQGVFQGKASCA